MPEELKYDFSMEERLKISNAYYNQQYMNKDALQPVWKKEDVDKFVGLAREGKLGGILSNIY